MHFKNLKIVQQQQKKCPVITITATRVSLLEAMRNKKSSVKARPQLQLQPQNEDIHCAAAESARRWRRLADWTATVFHFPPLDQPLSNLQNPSILSPPHRRICPYGLITIHCLTASIRRFNSPCQSTVAPPQRHNNVLSAAAARTAFVD